MRKPQVLCFIALTPVLLHHSLEFSSPFSISGTLDTVKYINDTQKETEQFVCYARVYSHIVSD